MLGVLLDILFPITCRLCGRLGSELCKVCDYKLPHPGIQICHVCGKESFLKPIHSDCQEYSYLNGVFYGCEYTEKSRQLVVALKYSSEYRIAKRMAEVINRNIVMPPAQLVPVPVSDKRLNTRGYNQAELLAEQLSVISGAALLRSVLIKSEDAQSQVGQGREERMINIQDSFRVSAPNFDPQQPIYLVDDVMTTGATLEACAKQLKLAGAELVYGVTFARKF